MKSLVDYEVLRNEVFYRTWHILDWIEAHAKEMTALDKEALKATIMDALVTRKQIDPEKQSLDFENLCIVDNLAHYRYEKHPNICGIPLWMKDEFRKKSLYITAGMPISLFLARPTSNIVRYCVYDPNTAVSSIFEDATFYDAYYDSPTRQGVRLDKTRPFVEVDIDGELYLVDILTKRILKSSWFKEMYNFEAKYQYKISEFDEKELENYKNITSERRTLWMQIPFLKPLLDFNLPDQAEQIYEAEQSKIYFPEEWEKAEEFMEEVKEFKIGEIKFGQSMQE